MCLNGGLFPKISGSGWKCRFEELPRDGQLPALEVRGAGGAAPDTSSAGFLICGVCGSRMTIVSGNGRRGYVKYGCPSHRNRGTCANSVMIRKDRLEDQLLTELTNRILQPAMENWPMLAWPAAGTVPKPPPELVLPAPLVVTGDTPACTASRSV